MTILGQVGKTDAALLSSIRAERLRMVYSAVPASLGTAVVVSTVLALLHWNMVETPVILGWLFVTYGVSVLRLGVFLRFRQIGPDPQAIRPWEQLALAGALLAGLSWGAASLLLFQDQSAVHQVYLALVIGGMAAGSVTTLSAQLPAAVGFILLAILPLLYRFMEVDHAFAPALSLLGALFLAMLGTSALRFYRTLTDIVAARYEREAAEEQLARSEARFRGFFERAPLGILIVDSEGRLIDANERLCEALACRREQLLGLSFFDLADGADRDAVYTLFRELVQGEPRAFRTEQRFLRQNGGALWANIYLTGVRNADTSLAFVIGMIEDITDRKTAECALRESEAKFSAAFHQAPLMVSISTLEEGRFLEVNQTGLEITGFDRDELVGHTSVELGIFAPREREQLKRALLQGSRVSGMEIRGRKKNGDEMLCRFFATNIDYGGARALLAFVEDITEQRRAQKALQKTEQRLLDAVESINEGFVLWDADDRLVLCNSRFADLFAEIAPLFREGVSFAEVVRESVHCLAELELGYRKEWMRRREEGHRLLPSTFEEQLADGRWIQVSERLTSDGGTVGIYTDITKLKQAEENIRYRAFFDPLTGLLNRAHFLERLEDALASGRRGGTFTALLFVDLDRFKHTNDALGHDVGDALLVEAAGRIRKVVRSTDIVARLGGDEFTVILHGLREANRATLIAETLVDVLARPYQLAGHEVHSGASIGITLSPADGDDPGTLLKNADMAMYRAKAQGRNTFHFFTAEMTRRAQHFVTVEKALRRSAEQGDFVLHYQPVLQLAGERVVGIEALVRWRHPDQGLVLPNDFIPVAEETGLIVELGEWVLRQACREAAGWVGCYLAVNVSSRQFLGGFDRHITESILRETEFPADRLVLEITESVLMVEDERIHQALAEFREMGIRLAMDDFGTGYSSLSYLRRFPFGLLKVDRSFVQYIDVNANDAKLVRSIIALGRHLGIAVVAEGVESRRQAAILRGLECGFVQGGLYGEPVPAEAMAIALARGDAPENVSAAANASA